MPECDFCYRPTRNRRRTESGLLECTACRDYREYYEALTPAQRAAEHAAEALYVTESEARGE